MILLSRSGPRSTEAKNLVKELAEKGVRICTPSCDISNRAALQSVLDSCKKEMPPIKGCIQSTMVMKVSTFEQVLFHNNATNGTSLGAYFDQS